MAGRNYDSNPQYDNWRRSVRMRDGRKCMMPTCGSKKKLQVHHIIPWSRSPGLRYAVSNGICLCKMHHDKIRGQEGLWAPLFQSIVNSKTR